MSRADHHRHLAWLIWRLVLGDLGYLCPWRELGRSLVAVWHRAGRVGVLAELGWSALTV